MITFDSCFPFKWFIYDLKHSTCCEVSADVTYKVKIKVGILWKHKFATLRVCVSKIHLKWSVPKKKDSIKFISTAKLTSHLSKRAIKLINVNLHINLFLTSCVYFYLSCLFNLPFVILSWPDYCLLSDNDCTRSIETGSISSCTRRKLLEISYFHCFFHFFFTVFSTILYFDSFLQLWSYFLCFFSCFEYF